MININHKQKLMAKKNQEKKKTELKGRARRTKYYDVKSVKSIR